MSNKYYLSDYIKTNDIENWYNNKQMAVIQAPTGIGKSTLIKTVLYDICKEFNQKILILVNREKLKDEFILEITKDEKNDLIDIKTYQFLEAFKKNTGESFNLNQYSFVVCDESHYFQTDSSFNKYTQESYNAVMESEAIKIFMSATNQSLINYLNMFEYEYKLYNIPINYNYVDTLNFFNKKLYIYDILKELKSLEEKCIVFMDDIQLAYEIYQMFEDDSLFLCSKNNKEYYKNVDEDKIKDMLSKQRFECLFLITTTVFVNGNNIKDEDLHHMIIQLHDLENIQQAIGRKRVVNDNDKLHIAFWNIQNQSIGGLLKKSRDMIEGAELLISEGEEKYVKFYGREYDPCVYDIYNNKLEKVEKVVNYFRYSKCINDINTYERWLVDSHKCGFKKDIIKMLGKTWSDTYKFNEDEVEGQNLFNEYLSSIEGKELDKEAQDKLIEKIGLRNNKGRLIKSISLLNNYLSEEKLGYQIITKRNRIDGKQVTFWIVINTDVQN